MLATCSSLGSIRLWNTTSWKLIQELRDDEEEKIEEFYTLRFTPDNTKLFAAGKLKHRDRWSNEDDDNQVAPGPIKVYAAFILAMVSHLTNPSLPHQVFDVLSGKVLEKFEGHTEEILCVKTVRGSLSSLTFSHALRTCWLKVEFKGKNYLLSASQDGYIIKWHLDETWTYAQPFPDPTPRFRSI